MLLVLALLLSQTGTCKAGVNCQANSYRAVTSQPDAGAAFAASGNGYIQLTGVTAANKPLCNAARKGALQFIRYTNDSGYEMCNGIEWIAAYGGSGGTSWGYATRTDAGVVSAFDQEFGGNKSFQGIILDAGVAFPLKVRNAVCVANTDTDLGNTAACTGHSISASGGSFRIGLVGAQEYLFNSGDIFNPRVYYAQGASTSPAFASTTGGYIDLVGVATGSLPTCNAGNAGIMQYDTTTNTYKWCNGSIWQSFSAVAAKSANLLTSVCFSATDCAEGANFVGATKLRDGANAFQVTCAWGAAGAGGATGVVVRLRNITASSTLCTCTLGACNTAAATPLSCSCSGAMVADEEYALQLDSTTDCSAGNNPGQIVCNLTNAN